MINYKMVDVEETPYLYCERSCSMDPDDISRTMGSAFRTVWEFIEANRITSAGRALSVYYTHDETALTFRAGFIVSPEDARLSDGTVRADVLPAGRVLNFIHRGPYATLRDSYGELMEDLARTGKAPGAPTWEVYLNDPDSVRSEEELETDIYVTLA